MIKEVSPGSGCFIPSPKPINALTEAFATMERTRQLTMRLSDVVDRICGAQPVEGSVATGRPLPDGVLPVLSYRATETAEMIEDAFALINRLEDAIVNCG